MTIKEAIQIFVWCDKRPAYRCSAAMIREAQEVAVSALRAQQTPLDRSRWDGCHACEKECCEMCIYEYCDMEEPPCSNCINGNMELTKYEPKPFCAKCGHPLTEEAWAALERRISGGTDDK